MPVDNAERPVVLTVESRVNDGRAVVSLTGELDLDGVDVLYAEVRALVDGRTCHTIEIDAAALTFVDSAGLHAILSAQAAAQFAEIGFRVVSLSPQLTRVVELTGLAAVLAI
jgi:anti-anti-sigma factor